MLSGVLQQVGSPMELYNNPANLFVAGFIGSPGMNFLPATLKNGTVQLPMVDVPLPQGVREQIGRQPDGRNLIAGIRPEDFEDATRVDRDSRARGVTFRSKLDLVEAMGAEFYAHFGIGAKPVKSEELAELREDAGGVEETTESGGIMAVARLSPQSRARSGEQAELWLDATRMHFFDAESGQALINGH
jgi:multiple sugar transport system ATP-binding protein